MKIAKEQIRQLLGSLPDNTTFNDTRYQLNDSAYALYVRQQIELGMQDSLAGRVVMHAEIKQRYQYVE